MNNRMLGVVIILTVILSGCALDKERTEEHINTSSSDIKSPYTDIVDRDIRALSEERIEALLDGAGAGYALSAELNSYPGPMHVLELNDEMSLTNEQTDKIEQIYAEMKKEAQKIGEQIVQLEADLEQRFRSREITEQDVRHMTEEIGRLDGKLRSVHLNAHIQTTALLTDDQVNRYDQLRGYANSNTPKQSHEDEDHGQHNEREHCDER